jgi:hypothetical protein
MRAMRQHEDLRHAASLDSKQNGSNDYSPGPW